MAIELTNKQAVKLVAAIGLLENMRFPEITDGNKQAELFDIRSELGDIRLNVEDQLDE